MKITFAIVVLTIATCTPVLAQNKSIYTSTRAEACRTINSDTNDVGSYEGECRGVGGYKLRLMEGDLRQALDVISPAGKRFELIKWGMFGGFSAIGDKVEWRMKGGVPVALIARYTVADSEPGKSKSYLIVSRIGAKKSCAVEIVEPVAKQNEKARDIADASANKSCVED